jgi:hypothetical protein
MFFFLNVPLIISVTLARKFLDMYNKSNPMVLANQMHHTPQQQQYNQYKQPHHEQQQHHSYWFASCNDIYNTGQPNLPYNAYGRHHQQHPSEQPMHQQNVIRRPFNLNSSGGPYVSRGAPPAYPSTSNSMAPSRSSSIQLPERNTAGNAMPTPKRPSGAATRIPQQSMSSFGNNPEHRQAVSFLSNFY